MIETGLAGKVVLVTGGAAGIGRATVERFTSEGAQVVAWDLTEGAGIERVDVTDEAAVAAATEQVVERFGRIDVLINNAGITRDAQLAKWKDGELASTMSVAEFESVLAVNLKGVFLPTRAVVPVMIRQAGGVILSASSVVGLYGNFGQTNYVATKAGVIGMTRTWARELGRWGIRVNAVAPGFIATEMVAKMPAKVTEGIAARTPLGRLGRPEEVAAVYLWLASNEASFLHGAVISVDGGMVIGT
ncbi:MAG TPA: SDR family oxidoreductase [Thermoanaerobaculia bacterium]|nr:SDR family oxidoreductase [Thermoanaerobaculia bacterium]